MTPRPITPDTTHETTPESTSGAAPGSGPAPAVGPAAAPAGRGRAPWRRITVGLSSAAAILALAACSVSSGATTASTDASSSASDSATTVSSSISGALGTLDTHYDDDDLVWEDSEVSTITLSDDGSSSDSDVVTVDGSTVTITAGGVYELSGSLSDGSVVVAAGDDETVTLVLNGVEVAASAAPALSVTGADEVTVYTAAGTENSFADGSSYEVADDSTPVRARCRSPGAPTTRSAAVTASSSSRAPTPSPRSTTRCGARTT
jgi:hypothetical protein